MFLHIKKWLLLLQRIVNDAIFILKHACLFRKCVVLLITFILLVFVVVVVFEVFSQGIIILQDYFGRKVWVKKKKSQTVPGFK